MFDQHRAYSQKEWAFVFRPLRFTCLPQAGALRLTVSEMAQDRLEECMQAVVTGTHPRTVKR